MKKLNLAISACVALCSVSFADENANLKAYELETIVVSSTANGVNSQVDSDKISVRKAGLVKDILRDIPGVYTGGTNQLNQRIYVRGSNDYGLNISIDGARQDGNVYHHAAEC